VVCVADTSVLIDVQYGGLVDAVMELPYTWCAPDLVLEEIEDSERKRWLALGLEERTLSGQQVNELFGLSGKHPRASVQDLAALVVAKTEGTVLVSGDGHLRKAAPEEGVKVHGTLWLLDRLRGRAIVTRRAAHRALKLMLANGSRLPEAEVARRLREWA